MINEIIKELKKDYDIRKYSDDKWAVQVWEVYISGKNQFDIKYAEDDRELILRIYGWGDEEGTFWLGSPNENTVKEIKEIIEKYKTD